jgi:hypothetical protein
LAGEHGHRKAPPEGEDWEYTQEGLRAWDEQVDLFESALFDAWRARTRSRHSRSLDGSDCRDASRYLLAGAPQPRWKTALRIFAYVPVVFGGVLIKGAFDLETNDPKFAMMAVGGLLIVVLIATLNETLLKR